MAEGHTLACVPESVEAKRDIPIRTDGSGRTALADGESSRGRHCHLARKSQQMWQQNYMYCVVPKQWQSVATQR